MALAARLLQLSSAVSALSTGAPLYPTAPYSNTSSSVATYHSPVLSTYTTVISESITKTVTVTVHPTIHHHGGHNHHHFHTPVRPGSPPKYTKNPSPPPAETSHRGSAGYPPLSDNPHHDPVKHLHYVPKPYGGPNKDDYWSPAFIPHGGSLKPGLPQKDTNGNSYWGLPNAPHLPPYLPSNPSGNGPSYPPWSPPGSNPGSPPSYPPGNTPGNPPSPPGSIPTGTIPPYPTGPGTSPSGTGPPTSTGTGTPPVTPCGPMPNTGVTRKYDFTVKYRKCAPDGVERDCVVINDQFPGPLIEANWGDWIEVRVTNLLDDEGTALHWHGLTQKETQWFDGVPTVDQCPIVPGKTFTYRFRADQYGSSWYHSHYSAQYSGGALGPLIIHGPSHVSYDIDIGPVLLSDWYHDSYFGLVNATMRAPPPGRPPLSQNNLINGKMNYPCANTTRKCTPNAGISKFTFKSGKKHLLRLINASGDAMQKFSIDNHTFTVIANDYVPIQPYQTHLITLGVGQRADVIVEATGKPGDSYWMRSQLGTGPTACSITDGISPNALAAVYYEAANTTAVPTSQTDVTPAEITTCANDPLSKTVPYCVQPLPPASITKEIDINFGFNGTSFVWTMNNQSFRGDYNSALLLNANQGNLNFKKEWNVYEFSNATSVRLVIYNRFVRGSHPMHLHGHNFWVVDEGYGTWNGTIQNPSNPQRRDVQILKIAQSPTVPSYLVIQFDLDNPGMWPLHCHVAWHVSAGLYVNILERAQDVRKLNIPPELAQTCQEWDIWDNTNVPNQIDSGL